MTLSSLESSAASKSMNGLKIWLHEALHFLQAIYTSPYEAALTSTSPDYTDMSSHNQPTGHVPSFHDPSNSQPAVSGPSNTSTVEDPAKIDSTTWTEISHIPKTLEDDEWKNGDLSRWPYCPKTIPENWRKWWFVPIYGGAQSRVRYDITASGSFRTWKYPLPYEPLVKFSRRLEQMKIRGNRTDDELMVVWRSFWNLYPPWRWAMQDMMPAIPKDQAPNKQTESAMLRLRREGVRWTKIPQHFRDLSEPICLVTYLRLVYDDWQGRDSWGESSYFLKKAEEAWKKTRIAQGLRLTRQEWDADEEEILVMFSQYGMSCRATSEEIDVRGPRSCTQHLSRMEASENCMAKKRLPPEQRLEEEQRRIAECTARSTSSDQQTAPGDASS
jgi:hypothetical protein